MARIITINDIKIKSVALTLNDGDGKVYIYIDYFLQEEAGTEWKYKTIVLQEKDLLPSNITKAKQIIEAARNKIKDIEGIS